MCEQKIKSQLMKLNVKVLDGTQFSPHNTLLGNIMACLIMTGEIMGGENMAELVQKPPTFPSHNFTCGFCFAKFFLNFKRIYSFLSIPDVFANYDQ